MGRGGGGVIPIEVLQIAMVVSRGSLRNVQGGLILILGQNPNNFYLLHSTYSGIPKKSEVGEGGGGE